MYTNIFTYIWCVYIYTYNIQYTIYIFIYLYISQIPKASKSIIHLHAPTMVLPPAGCTVALFQQKDACLESEKNEQVNPQSDSIRTHCSSILTVDYRRQTTILIYSDLLCTLATDSDDSRPQQYGRNHGVAAFGPAVHYCPLYCRCLQIFFRP